MQRVGGSAGHDQSVTPISYSLCIRHEPASQAILLSLSLSPSHIFYPSIFMYLRIYTFVDVYKMYTVIGCYMCVCVCGKIRLCDTFGGSAHEEETLSSKSGWRRSHLLQEHRSEPSACIGNSNNNRKIFFYLFPLFSILYSINAAEQIFFSFFFFLLTFFN